MPQFSFTHTLGHAPNASLTRNQQCALWMSCLHSWLSLHNKAASLPTTRHHLGRHSLAATRNSP